MPTVKRFRNCRICIFTPDHAPPHFHIVGPDISAVVEVDSLRLVDGSVVGAEEAMDWARANKEVLMDTWRFYNPGRR